MDYKPNIELIDPHPKSNSRDDNIYFVCHPAPLDFFAFTVGKVSMIVITCYFVLGFESLTKLLAIFARNAINNSTLVLKF